MKGYITKEQLSDSLKQELNGLNLHLENIENKLCININDFNAIADDDIFDNIAAYIVVWYVKDNYIFTFNDANYNFTKTGSGDPVGKKIFYQSYSKSDLSDND